jgi:hypothetical protein
VTTGADSPNLQYFKGLLSRDPNTIPLNDFLKLWDPVKGDGLKAGSAYFDCENWPMGTINKGFKLDGPVPSECHPDVLYSWGPPVKSKSIFDHLQDGTEWTGPINQGAKVKSGTVFTSLSAVSTFGFGDVLLRLKIKPTAPYHYVQFGAKMGEVAVRPNFTYHDVAVQDSSLVESASQGTPEIYDELVRDILHFKSKQRISAYTPNDEEGLSRIFHELVDGHDNSVLHLKKNLLELIREIVNGEGVITYNKGSCRNRALTFGSAHPNYMQPMSAAEEGVR